ncbi:porin family protein [Lutibacter sp. A64]|uniref:outer membrane beta-barrel protein n=1 Tax=Lutibacter sp. A64 TaxID=2918526 RepID=UPI001F06BA3D|nr:outer membrane beta-barrel protein [Lutibacter sp. A64]UMB52534.1 porin family protein [Lutibacter sp. A64]
MKTEITFVLFLLFTINSFSQDSKFSIGVNFPVLIDNNHYGENYNGIIDLGLEYRISNFGFMDLGFALNTSLFNTSYEISSDFTTFNVKENIFFIRPKVFSEIIFKSNEKIHPRIGVGYTFIKSKVSAKSSDFPNESKSYSDNGLNLNLGVAYDITNKIFIQAQYDYIKKKISKEVPDYKYYSNINFLNIGLGYRF